MTRPKVRSHVEDLRGASRLAIEATKGVTDLVEAMHQTIGAGPDILGRPFALPIRVITAPVYGNIRAVTKLVGNTLEFALRHLEPLLGNVSSPSEGDVVRAVLNGVMGDYLQETRNPLAIVMQLMHAQQPIDLEQVVIPAATSKLLVLVHGSSMSFRQWSRNGHDHGVALANGLGFTPVYASYNSGLHISANGHELSEMLEKLVCAWPTPLKEIVLVGHSMGGLVARSACHYAEMSACSWRTKLSALICLGSPHHGAPLERGGNFVDALLGTNRYSSPLARLSKIRSAGVTDLRYGNVLHEHWQGRDRFEMSRDLRTPLPLPSDVSCYAIAGTTSDSVSENLRGDGLVPVDSALGRHSKPELVLKFSHSIALHTGHLELLESLQVLETMRAWLASE